MGLDLQKWNPFKFSRGRTESWTAGTGPATGAAPSDRSGEAGLEPARLLQAIDPFGLLPALFRSPLAGATNIGRWFGDFSPAIFQPRIDVVDDGDVLRITAELPGMEKEDLELIVEDGFLVLRGEKRRDSTQEETGCYRLERAFGRFQRILPLPDGVDVERAEARFVQGVLTLGLPKKPVDDKASRKVTIQ
jgi:HSP20 family protein